MSDRRRGNKLQGYRYMLYLVVRVISHITGIDMTACTDQTKVDNINHVIPMCKGGGTLHNIRVVIDTWDTGGPDVYSCTCTVILYQKTPPSTVTTITIQEYPGVEPWSSCGSKLRITSTTSDGFTETGCTPITSTTATNFGTTDELTLTLSRANNNTQWQSGHCILIQTGIGNTLDVSVTCLLPNTISTTLPSSHPPTTITTTTTTTSPTTTSTTTTMPTTTQPATTTTETTKTPTNKSPSTTSQTTVTTETATPNDTDLPESTEYVAGESDANQSNTNLIIIAGAAGGGGFVVIIIIIVIVIIVNRKRSTTNKPPNESVSNVYDNSNYDRVEETQPNTSNGTMPRYVNDHGDTLTHNSLYQSAGPRDPDARHIVTEAGDVYAQVQKPGKQSLSDDKENEKLELEETSKGDVYAVVNKSKKQNNSETVDNPSRYTSADGLVYAEVGVQDGTARPSARVKSTPPPVSPKPKVDSESVVYAKVNTGI